MMVKITVLQLAQVLRKKIEKSKHEKARKLMESHLIHIYIESYIDLEKKEANILCFSKRKPSEKLKKEYISEMAQSILKTV